MIKKMAYGYVVSGIVLLVLTCLNSNHHAHASMLFLCCWLIACAGFFFMYGISWFFRGFKRFVVLPIICLIGCMLFVPYESGAKRYIGYGFFFAAPKVDDVRIVTERVVLEMATICLVTFAAYVGFEKTKRPLSQARIAEVRSQLSKMIDEGNDELRDTLVLVESLA